MRATAEWRRPSPSPFRQTDDDVAVALARAAQRLDAVDHIVR
jgi:hypothetical protein